MKRSIKEIALELLEKYQAEAESVNWERGTSADEEELAEEIRRYREEIEEADQGGKMKEINVMLDPGAVTPVRAHEADAGLDLFIPTDIKNVVVFPKNSVTIDTGVHVEIPEGYVGLLKSKSGLNVKSDLTGEGVIDAGYTGSIVAKLYNNGNQHRYLKGGDKLIQLLIIKCETPTIKVVDSFKETERGAAGFGSTGR